MIKKLPITPRKIMNKDTSSSLFSGFFREEAGMIK
jgi:hypothetical protein